LCPQDSVRIGGEWINKSGQYIYELVAQSGCDSVYIANIEKLVAPDRLKMEIDCEKPVVRVEVTNFDYPRFDTLWNIQWSNGDTTASTTYQGGENANVLLNADPDCQVEYNFQIPELPDLSQLPYFADILINPTSTVSLQLDLNPDEWQVEWSPSNIIDCPSCMDVEISATQNVEITIKLTHSSGCIYTKSFTISIDLNEDIYVPNIFSPDGDGHNDTWYITFKDYHPMIIEAAIFDRWGEKVAEWHNVPNVDWDGIFKGKRVNTGVFVYYFKYKGRDGKEVIVKGDVTVL
jgi:gliding motility-associated-like protein